MIGENDNYALLQEWDPTFCKASEKLLSKMQSLAVVEWAGIPVVGGLAALGHPLASNAVIAATAAGAIFAKQQVLTEYKGTVEDLSLVVTGRVFNHPYDTDTIRIDRSLLDAFTDAFEKPMKVPGFIPCCGGKELQYPWGGNANTRLFWIVDTIPAYVEGMTTAAALPAAFSGWSDVAALSWSTSWNALGLAFVGEVGVPEYLAGLLVVGVVVHARGFVVSQTEAKKAIADIAVKKNNRAIAGIAGIADIADIAVLHGCFWDRVVEAATHGNFSMVGAYARRCRHNFLVDTRTGALIGGSSVCNLGFARTHVRAVFTYCRLYLKLAVLAHGYDALSHDERLQLLLAVAASVLQSGLSLKDQWNSLTDTRSHFSLAQIIYKNRKSNFSALVLSVLFLTSVCVRLIALRACTSHVLNLFQGSCA